MIWIKNGGKKKVNVYVCLPVKQDSSAFFLTNRLERKITQCGDA